MNCVAIKIGTNTVSDNFWMKSIDGIMVYLSSVWFIYCNNKFLFCACSDF